jgi:hypothetical protein
MDKLNYITRRSKWGRKYFTDGISYAEIQMNLLISRTKSTWLLGEFLRENDTPIANFSKAVFVAADHSGGAV